MPPYSHRSHIALQPVADLGLFRGDDFGNPTRTEGVWAHGKIHDDSEYRTGQV